MTTSEAIYKALLRLEERKDDLAPAHREQLRPAFAALHGGQALYLPEQIVRLIRMLDVGVPQTETT